MSPDPGWPGSARSRRSAKKSGTRNSSVPGKLPGTLEFLVPDFLAERRDLADPGHPGSGDIGYFYYGTGKTTAEPGDSIFLAAKAEQKGYRVVVRFDGQ